MKDPDGRKYSRERKRPLRLQREGRFSENRFYECPNDDPGIERGERIATAKTIARRGMSSGDVQGATSNYNPERHFGQ